MGYKDILVYLDPTPASDERLRLAVALAKREGARLLGVDASSQDAFLGAWRDQAVRIGDNFEETLREAQIEGQLIGDGFREPTSSPDYANCVDLAIAPRPDEVSRALVRADLPDQAVTTSGAPMLIVPQGWKYGPLGDRVVVAWNGSREAIRAVHDAMPLLQKARKVVIFSFSTAPSGLRESAELLRAHLSRHGVTAEISDWTNTGDMTAVDALFASLDTQDADLIVAGAYGHPRHIEQWFGGVSVDLLRQPMLPLLMSH